MVSGIFVLEERRKGKRNVKIIPQIILRLKVLFVNSFIYFSIKVSKCYTKTLNTPYVSIPYETLITPLGAVEIHKVKLSIMRL